MNNMKNLSLIEKKYTKDSEARDFRENRDSKEQRDNKNIKENIVKKQNPIIQDKRNKVEDNEDDFEEGVMKIERSEKIITDEKGNKKKIVKLTKYMEDGEIKYTQFKENID